SRDRMTDAGAPVPNNAGAGQAPTRGPHTAWMGQHSAPISNDEQASLDKLMELLSGRRGLLGKLRPDAVATTSQRLLDTADLVSALGHVQTQQSAAPQSLADIKQNLLAQARQRTGAGAELSQQDNDTFELLGMLYAHMEEEIRRDAPAA